MREEVETGRHDKATQAGDKSRERKSKAAGERETCRMRGSGREERRSERRGWGRWWWWWCVCGAGGRVKERGWLVFKDRQ